MRTGRLPRTCLILYLSIPINHSGCGRVALSSSSINRRTWEECRRSIEEMQQAELPDRKLFLDSEEERYNKYLQSEDALSSLLGFSAIVCILISIFGIYSLVSLTCEQRRKEIAIRKVNGATISNILSIFFKEYAMRIDRIFIDSFPCRLYYYEALDRTRTIVR